MNSFQIRVHCGEECFTLCADGEKSILQSLGTTHGPNAPCGGRGVCGKCRVELKGLLRSLDSGEITETEGEILACRYAPTGDCELWLPPENEAIIAVAENVKISGGREGLGLAVDIGTTTIVSALYDLKTGECVAEKSELNAQRVFGADVVSRMEHCRKGSFDELYACMEKQLSALAEDKDKISRVSIVGNTVMQHFAAGLDPSDMAVPPFEVKSLFGAQRSLNVWPDADVYFARCISAYVGGDVVAGMLACGLQDAEEPCLYVDIGTNGELAIGDKRGYKTCATAAGPAFEGAEISCGMNAAEGAIDRVWTEKGEIRTHVLGGVRARGICGSGIIDAVAVLLDLGLISRSGRLVARDKAPAELRSRFVEKNGTRAFSLCDGVYLSLRDIHKVQLAKAAIRGGIELLLKGKAVKEIIVAGGFGKYMNVISAIKIGLLPPVSESIVRQAGNAAAKGAAMLLDRAAEEKLRALADKCTYVDLSSSEEFSESYISYLNF
ncbi:MAG: ASKHA domain-containing protein [Bacillota bacterium]|nr:ASKHA domain-containing protein [Bacillota bacterium]